MLRLPPLGLCATGATGEGVCSGRQRSANVSKTGDVWFEDAATEAGIKNFRWYDLSDRSANRLRIIGIVATLKDVADLVGQEFDHGEAVRASRSEQAARGRVATRCERQYKCHHGKWGVDARLANKSYRKEFRGVAQW
jgi:hypothetical protein